MKIGICVSNTLIEYQGRFEKIINHFLSKSKSDWSSKFEEFANKHDVEYTLIYLDQDDWIEQINNIDYLVWKPKFMGVESSSFFKEKIYFIQHILNKRVMPNYETVWHFDSKIAQSYLLKKLNIPSPKTYVSFDYNNALEIAEKVKYPVIYKKSNGAGSTGVKMVKNKKKLVKEINYVFVWRRFINRIMRMNLDNFGYIYLQDYLNNNPGDLRVNTIGDRYAYGFWRENRVGDFRASGSGLLNYDKEIPGEIINYCLRISSENKFDSMAFDIMFDQNDNFKIIEISYGYIDSAVFNSYGLYEKQDDIINFHKGNYWPQEIWILWLKNSNGKFSSERSTSI